MRTQTQENLILATDSYKVSHHRQYPKGMTAMFDYMESRGGKHPETLFFGLQYILLHYLTKRVTHQDVDEAAPLLMQHFGTGELFPEAGWRTVVDKYEGRIPLRIRALPEGTVVDTGTPLFTVECVADEEDKLFWLVSWFEGLLQKVWFPTTVATEDFYTKLEIYRRLVATCDNPDAEIGFKLHDFGYRGVSSDESARIGGAAALVNFLGTDTLQALTLLRDYYGEPCAGFSIAASEHSTMTILGPEGEEEQMRRMISEFGHLPIFACVSDSYDLFEAVSGKWGGTLKEAVLTMPAVLVVRPDSGDPVEIVFEVVRKLDESFGHTVNSKGFKVLNKVRVIQGDGIRHDGVIGRILDRIIEAGYSAENVAFGMGGGRVQQMDRDTQRFAIKCCAAIVDGEERAVRKEPKTDPGKRSKGGYLDVIHGWAGLETVVMPYGQAHPNSALAVVFEMGEVLVEHSLADIRARVAREFEMFV